MEVSDGLLLLINKEEKPGDQPEVDPRVPVRIDKKSSCRIVKDAIASLLEVFPDLI